MRTEETAQLMKRTLLSRPNLEKVVRETDLNLRAKTPEQLETLRAQQTSDQSLIAFGGTALLMALAIFSLWRYVLHYQKRVRYQRVQHLYLLSLLVLVLMVALATVNGVDPKQDSYHRYYGYYQQTNEPDAKVTRITRPAAS